MENIRVETKATSDTKVLAVMEVAEEKEVKAKSEVAEAREI